MVVYSCRAQKTFDSLGDIIANAVSDLSLFPKSGTLAWLPGNECPATHARPPLLKNAAPTVVS